VVREVQVRKCIVYVVDDDPSVLKSTAFLLRALAVECRTFASGEELLDVADQLPPGCVLLDLLLPRKDGLEVQAELATRGPRFPVVTMTGGANREAAAQALAMGAVEVLEKPFAEEALIDALDRACARLQVAGLVPMETVGD
jgi:two-component system response regulator FixJ